MATPPDFTTGQVLTAAQMNAVGLWLIKTQTVGSAVTSVTVTSAFSADYESYKILWQDVLTSATSPTLQLKLGSSTTNYQFAGFYNRYAASTLQPVANASSSQWEVQYAGGGAEYLNGSFEIHNPFRARSTNYTAVNTGQVYQSVLQGFQADATSYTSFILSISSGTLTGGTIRVYGYRN